MKNIFIPILTLFIFICHTHAASAKSGFEPAINGVVNDAINSSLSKEQIDAVSDTMSRAADVYLSAKSSAAETQKLLSGTVTQEAQQTRETKEPSKIKNRSNLLEFLKKIETVFLDAASNSNNHK